MRVLVFGIAAALVFGFFNGALVYFSKGSSSLLYMGIFGAIPIDWILIGSWMGFATGYTHKGVGAADGKIVFYSGALAGLLCTFIAHVIQYTAIVGEWNVGVFINYLNLYGVSVWNIGSWYIWFSTALATLTAGITALGLSSRRRVENLRAELPDWLSPTIRILIHVARADGTIDDSEIMFIQALVRAQMLKGLGEIPNDVDRAVDELISSEIDILKEGQKIENDLIEKCFSDSQEQRELSAKLAIAITLVDGKASNSETLILEKIFKAWNISSKRSMELENDAYEQFHLNL